ncbi:MAG: TRAP transporter small permease [Deferrisomatales bacterium]|nr:TRAP transporter small permease [Deferrisomatales bacterium]
MAAEHLESAAFRSVRVLRRVEDALLVLLVGSMVLLAAGQILLRNAFDIGWIWVDPLLRALVLWVGLFGALVASREDRHISIDVLSRLLPGPLRAGARSATSLFTAAVSAVIAYHAARFVVSDYGTGATAFARIPVWVVESILPFAFGIISLRYLALFALHLGAAMRGKPG